MNTRFFAGAVAVVISTVSGAAFADHDQFRPARDHEDYARVIRVEPLVQRVRITVPVQQCWTEERGHGVATVGGAILGAAVGDALSRADGREYDQYRREPVERCSTRQEDRYEDRVMSYRVTYEYNGRLQVAQLPYDPGRYVRVSVDVRPLG